MMTVCLFPTATGILWTIFNLNSSVSLGGLLGTAFTVLFGAAMLAPYVLPLALIKLRAEPYILPQSMS
jgi:hypothetical protein